ncbi:phosphoribosylanthranilate isomerase [Salinimicrobium marinum]|nr:phosphoribosylanthranilate isomerase [Salinimicrobium marinum]
MKFPENIEQVAVLQPDYLGFIFFEKSPRNFEVAIPELDKAIKKTGVFVDASLDFILEKVKKHELQAVQLHGKESPEFCAALKAVGLEIIKVFSVKDSFDFSILQQYESKVDFFLFDTKGKAKGGNGITFDWEVLKNYPSETPFFLSGGIGLEEIGRLKDFEFSKAFYGIDVNSRFELEPGFKNLDTLKELRTIIPQR